MIYLSHLFVSFANKMGKEFKVAAAENGIKHAPLEVIKKAEYDSVLAISVLEDEDITTFSVSKPQKDLLKRWRDKCSAIPPAADNSSVPATLGNTSDSSSARETTSLDTLRSDVALQQRVHQQLKNLGLDNDSDDDDDEKSGGGAGGKKLRSGRNKTSRDIVVKRLDWPQYHVYRGADRKPATFDTLSVPEFVFGYITSMSKCSNQKTVCCKLAINHWLLKKSRENVFHYKFCTKM